MTEEKDGGAVLTKPRLQPIELGPYIYTAELLADKRLLQRFFSSPSVCRLSSGIRWVHIVQVYTDCY